MQTHADLLSFFNSEAAVQVSLGLGNQRIHNATFTGRSGNASLSRCGASGKYK